LPVARLRASIEPATWDADKRTFVVALYTGATIQRYSWARDEVYDLTLEVSAEACDLSFLNSGRAPFLLDHNAYNVAESVAGVFTEAWIRDGVVYGRVRASDREEFAGVYKDVAAGILGNVSVGADVHESVWAEREGGKRRLMTAKRWKPHEGSLVAIGADENAAILSRGSANYRTTTCIISSESMSEEVDVEVLKATAREEASKAERARIVGIQRAGLKLQASREAIDELVTSGATLDAAREKLIELAAAKDEETPTRSTLTILREPRDGMRDAMEAYLLHRADPKKHKLTDKRAAEYVGMSLLDLGRACLDANSVPHRGKSRLEVVNAAMMSTSDFPELLANTANKSLRVAYQAYPSNWQSFTRVVPAADFKQISAVSIGDAPKLLEVGELGEFTRGKLTENAEKYALKTYGRVLSISRQAIVNDDMDALSRIPQMMGTAAAALVADLVYAILTDNAALSDSVALFHATHANLGTGAISVASLSAMRAAMRVQTGPNALILNVTPAYIIVPAAIETTALQFLRAEINPNAASSANPFRGTIDVIVEPRLDAASATVWYASAMPSQMDTIQVSFLEGQGEGPMIESRTGFDVDGVEIKCRMDVAAKAVEYRGLYKSTGA
jgi:phage major head subunit gpT-like protein